MAIKRPIIAGHNNRIKINNREVIPLGIPQIVSSDKDDPTQQRAYFSLKDQSRPKWLLIDLETGDNWIPSEDPEYERLIRLRDSFLPGSIEYQEAQKAINIYMKEHPAFIRHGKVE